MGDGGDFQRGTRVYVGGLSHATKKEDLEMEFEKFGKLNNVWVAFNPPGFAFIEFSNRSDAENACDSMNGTELLGGKLRVELSRNRGRGGSRGRGGRGGGFRGGNDMPGGGFGWRGRGGFRAGGRGGGDGGFGGTRRGGFGRGRDYSRNGGQDGYGDGSNGGDYGPSNGNYGGGYGRNSYGGEGASSRYRSRSPISSGGGGTRRY